MNYPLSRLEKRSLRYRWHKLAFTLSVFLTSLTVCMALAIAGVFLFFPEMSSALDTKALDEIYQFVVLALVFPFALGFIRLLKSAQSKTKGCLVDSQQFPQVLSTLEGLAHDAGLERTPLVVVVPGLEGLSHSLQAGGESVILIHSDLLNAPRPDGTLGALHFALAREVGNLSANHQALWYEFSTTVSQSIPFLKNLLNWTETYTADRYGAALAPEYAADYFGVLALSKDCWLDFHPSQTIKRAGREKIFNLVAAWTNPAPPLPWRMLALAHLGVFRGDMVGLPHISTQDLEKYHAPLFSKPAILEQGAEGQMVAQGSLRYLFAHSN